ncbi:MAG: hypothetical protein EDX89_24580, partial [Acidobacteria bacterium]
MAPEVSMRNAWHGAALLLLFVLLPAPPGLAGPQEEPVPLAGWAAPPFWLPSAPDRGAREDAAILPAAGSASPDALPSGALPFFAITP